MAAFAIEARDLVKTYPGDVPALQGLSFEVEPSTVFGLLGPNGAGKSTTVKILNTLTQPDSGSAQVAGIDVIKAPDRVRRSIGYVSQKSAVDPEATGQENLTLQGQLHGLSGSHLRQRVSELLRRFGLSEAGKRLVRTYSGGMIRKLDVAMGLAHRPEVLFLDEPTTGLDPEARADMWDELARLAHDDGLTILLTTHYLEEADRLARRLAIIDRGRVVAEGSPDELKAGLRAEPDARLRGALDRVNGLLRDISIDGRMVRARVDSGASAVPAVLAALDAAGVGVATVTMARPSLDDVYLRHAGRAFRAADGEDAQ
jgi:ABC-2 type transport system ATP-binding protein